MLSVILEWLRGHLGPSDVGMDEILDIRSAEDGWMLVDVVRDNGDAVLLRDYLVIPDLNSRPEQFSDECVTVASSNGGICGEYADKVARPLALACRPAQHFQRARRGKMKPSFSSVMKICSSISVQVLAKRSPAIKSTTKTTPLVCDELSAVKKMKLQCDIGKNFPRASAPSQAYRAAHYHHKLGSFKPLSLTRHALNYPTFHNQTGVAHSFTPIRVKNNKSARFLIDDVGICPAQRNDFSSALCILEDVGRISDASGFRAVGNEIAQELIDAVVRFKEGSRVLNLRVDKNTYVVLVISGQADKVKSVERTARMPLRSLVMPKKPTLALEWRTTVESNSNAALMRKLRSAVAQKVRGLCQDALDLMQADPMSYSIYLPFNLRLVPALVPSRLLAPIVTLQVLWAHLVKLLSGPHKEEERQLKRFPGPTRQRALIRGRNRSLSRYMKDRVMAEKKAQQRYVNKRSLERTHRAMFKSRDNKSNRKRALSNGRFNCMVGRRGQ